jgi:hypothetical protein
VISGKRRRKETDLMRQRNFPGKCQGFDISDGRGRGIRIWICLFFLVIIILKGLRSFIITLFAVILIVLFEIAIILPIVLEIFNDGIWVALWDSV